MRLKVQILVAMVVVGIHSATNAKEATPYPVGAWYWINAVRPTQWQTDLKNMRRGGFTYVVGAFGYDATALQHRKKDVRAFLTTAKETGLGVYLSIWSPSWNSLPIPAGMETVDELGNVRFGPNIYERKWVDEVWVPYLKNIGEITKGFSNFLGYYFDDTFQIGRPEDSKAKQGKYASYSALDQARFQKWLKKKYGTLKLLHDSWKGEESTSWESIPPPRDKKTRAAWSDWISARGEWLEYWAKITRRILKTTDPNPSHILVLVDDEWLLQTQVDLQSDAVKARAAIGAETAELYIDQRGLDIQKVAKYWDAISVYATFMWTSEKEFPTYLKRTKEIIKNVQQSFDGKPYPFFTFWGNTDFNKNLKDHPTGSELVSIIRAAQEAGARATDIYAYRSGDWRIFPETRPDLLPGKEETYPIAPPFTGVYLVDRPNVMSEFREALKRL